MWYQIIQYFKFLLKSTNQHGVHSPFVFNLITKCFYDKTDFPAYKNISKYKKDLLCDKTKISVTDLGAGSQISNALIRSVSNIARHSGTTSFRSKLLYRLANYFKPKNILELGTSLGIATHAMHLGNPEANITTIEGCPNISEFSRTNFEKNHIQNFMLLNTDFKNALKDLTSNSFDLIFFDGNHKKEATLQYFESLLPTIHNDSVLIFDDIYWSKSMTEAWDTIKQHPKVTVSIDTFFWGLVFFRHEQPKEHFTIRL
jgi:predicted O-methyltransferase YrrM